MRLRCLCDATAVDVLALARDHADDIVDRHIGGAFRHDDLGEHAFIDGFDFHGRLVGLDLGDHIAGLDRVALLLQPAAKGCLFPWSAKALA